MGSPRRFTPHSNEVNIHRLWGLIEGTSSGMYLWDFEKDSIYWSDGLFKSLGYDPGEKFDYETLKNWIHPDDLESHTKNVMDAREVGGSFKMEARIKHSDGHFLWMESNGKWFQSESGQYDHLMGFIYELSRTQRANEALKRSESRFRTFFDMCPAAVYVKDKDSKHIYGNQKAAQISGVSVDEFIGTYTSELFDEESAKRLIEVDQKVFKENKPQNWTGTMSTKDGQHLEVFTTKFPIEDLYTGETFLGGFGIDLTDERKATARANHKQRLESLGLLAGGVAHDFNNQLAVMIGTLELIREDIDEKNRKRIDRVLKASQMSADLCRQLLTYSGRSKGSPEVIDLGDFITSSLPILKAAIKKKTKLRMDFKYAPARLDKALIQQIVFNLVFNAVESYPESGGNVELNCGVTREVKPKDFDYFVDWRDSDCLESTYLSVKDFGCGIPSEKLPEVFEPFYTTKSKGAGMGLAAVLGAVKSNNGAIGVNSKEGEGTTFQVFFRSERAFLEEQPGETYVEDVSGDIFNGLALVVDDNELVAATVGEMLQRLGLDTELILEPRIVLDRLKNSELPKTDLMVIDFSMPGISGIELYEKVRREYEDLPIIILSGNSVGIDIASNDKYLRLFSKPINLAHLQGLLKELLN